MTAREKRLARYERMQEIVHTLDERSLTAAEKAEFDRIEIELTALDREVAAEERAVTSYVETRGGGQAAAEVQGRPNELLAPGQSMTEWVQRAAQNGLQVQTSGQAPHAIEHRDEAFMNEALGQRLGFARRGAELRALGEDTSGSGLAITPESWTASFIDYLYPASVLGRAGISRVPLQTELQNVPVFTAPVAPAWLAESSSIGIDANPAFSTLQLNAMGGFKDITLYSMELAQDAYVQGGLPGMLLASAARKYALAVDNAGLFGVAGNAGSPGLINETGFTSRGYTGDSGSGETPSDTSELSVVMEIIANKNIDVMDPAMRMAILSNPSVYSTIMRTKASTYAKWWQLPPDVQAAGLGDRWFTSTTFPTTETDGTDGAGGALTGGALSSLYMGPFSYGLFGVHLEMESRVLTERYIDYGQFGLFTWMRFSIRWGHPETFVRTGGIVTS